MRGDWWKGTGKNILEDKKVLYINKGAYISSKTHSIGHLESEHFIARKYPYKNNLNALERACTF